MITKIRKNVFKINFQNFGSIIYYLKINSQNILIDTSSEENKKELIVELKKLKLFPEDINTIILTHAHYDHIENISLFENAKIYGNFTEKIEKNHKKTKLQNILPIDSLKIKKIKIYKTPGHTQKDIIILYDDILFSGDVIFEKGYIGRIDFPESNPKKMKESLQFISQLKFNILCPGH